MAKAKVKLIDVIPSPLPGDPLSTLYTVYIDYADPALRDETQVYRWSCADKPALRAKLDELADHYEAEVVKRGRTAVAGPDAVPVIVERGAKGRAFEKTLIDVDVAAK